MNHRKSTVLLMTAIVVAGGGVAMLGSAVAAPPQPPAAYYGEVDIGGNPAPEGVTIEAQIEGDRKGEITIQESGEYGGPNAGDRKLEVECGECSGGEIVRFFINGVEAEETVEWESADVQEVDLSFPDEAEPTPTETAPPGGGDGGDGGPPVTTTTITTTTEPPTPTTTPPTTEETQDTEPPAASPSPGPPDSPPPTPQGTRPPDQAAVQEPAGFSLPELAGLGALGAIVLSGLLLIRWKLF